MSEILRVFIGFDSKEPVTFAVACHSLLAHASRPVSITPLVQRSLRSSHLYTRDRRPNESTEFSLTRFLCPSLADFTGYSLFLDSDVLVQADVWDLLIYPLTQPGKALWVCQHDYTPRDLVKFDGHEQTTYAKKNWSSVMLLDNAKCQALTPAYVNKATGLELHRFQWVESDAQIGSLPLEWNHLVGEYAPNPKAKILHYTSGAPCFKDYSQCDHADLWWQACADMVKPCLGEVHIHETVAMIHAQERVEVDDSAGRSALAALANVRQR